MGSKFDIDEDTLREKYGVKALYSGNSKEKHSKAFVKAQDEEGSIQK